jgi:hypothetical protein
MVDEERRMAADGRLSHECLSWTAKCEYGVTGLLAMAKNAPPFSYLFDPNPNSNLKFLPQQYFELFPGES